MALSYAILKTIMIIDSHSHLCKKRNESFREAAQELLLELKDNQISKAFVIPDNVENSKCASIDILLKVFTDNSNIYFLGSPNPFADINNECQKLEALIGEKKIIGVKLFPGHDKIRITDNKLQPIIKLCIKYNIPLVVHSGAHNETNLEVMEYNDPKYVVEIASNNPSLNIIISHFFWPKLDYCYKATQGFKNIYFDTSALADTEVIQTSGGIDKIRSVLEKTILRNSDSVIFGTDYPACNTQDHLKLINDLDISFELKEKIFFKNVLKLFGL